jgi:hypothetical protein
MAPPTPTRAPRTAPAIRPGQRRGTTRRRPPDRGTASRRRGIGTVLLDAAATVRRLYAKRSRGTFAAPGKESAGRVFAILAASLALAVLVNADAMVRRAEQKPLGGERDRSLALWHPVQDVAHVLQLHRLRAVADTITGNDEADSASPVPTTAPPIPTSTVPPRPELRVPTTAAPLRVWVGGDSMMRDLSESVQRLAAGNALLAVTAHYEISSGLTRPDYFDWPDALRSDMTDTDAEVAVVMFGANDGQGLIAPDGTTYQRVSEPGWQREYADRVAALMDQLRADGRLVLWVTQPPMRDGDFDARMDIVNEIYRAAASTRPWVDLVETALLFGDSGGAFADRLPGPDGELRDLRQDDGIHLSREGADLLAAELIGRIVDEFTPG